MFVQNAGDGDAGAAATDADITCYAHFEVDRFAVLLDVWSNEMSFLQCKKEVSFAKSIKKCVQS